MCHVLIIEDDPLVALHLQMLLEEHGATSVAIAETETEAIRAASANPPAVITSDINLRQGSGPVAVQAIHERHGAIPVIFITAMPEACPSCGPHERLFGKPIDEFAVAQAFRELFPA